MTHANLPWVESPFFYELLKTKNLSEAQSRLVREYHTNGFVVVSGLLPQSLIDKTQEDVEKKAFNPDFSMEGQRDPVRVQDFWKISQASKDVACFPGVLELLKLLYDREPIPFQTLNFSAGSQQRGHSDTIHFSSLPAKFMCGVWVALEDITEENGPVFYYPGSQNLMEYDFSQIRTVAETPSYGNYKEYEDFIEKIVEVNKLEKKAFLAKKGDLLIWSSNIIHGGSPVTRTGASRWSQVTHYFFADCYFYTPMLSNMVTHELYLRKGLVDIKNGQQVTQSYNGKKLKAVRTNGRLYFLADSLPNPVNYLKSLVSQI